MATTERAAPADWRGSDLRSRREVVQYLAKHGGVLEDKTGLVAGKMRDDLQRGRALAQLLADMEQDEMIERVVRGRRTFRIELVNDWGLTDQDADATDDALNDLAGGDLTALAETLLAIVVRRMTAAVPDGGPSARELADRLRRTERELKDVSTELREKREVLTATQEQLQAAKEQAGIAAHNVEVLRKELNRAQVERKQRSKSGVPLGDQIGEEGRKALASLMKALPETPASKPRREAK